MTYFQAFKLSIARIFAVNNEVMGAGFLVSERHVLTCAHVVAAALGLPSTTAAMPEDVVEFDMPLLAGGQRVKGKLVFWQPVNPGQVGEDIAVLEVEIGSLPSGAQAVRLMVADEPWEHKFRIFGFPEDRDDGIWASGVLRERQGAGWVQLEDLNAQGYAIEKGFSGAPVWDEELEAVVGMAVAADRDRVAAKAAFMIPISVVMSAGAMLGRVVLPKAPSQSISSFQEVKCRALVKSLKILYAQYEEAYNQRSSTLNAADRPILDVQIEQFEERIKQLTLEFTNNNCQ
jgi:S1-C subfamily serine protease